MSTTSPVGPVPSVGAGSALPSALCVLGLGLIGGSLLRAAADRVPVQGWSPGEATRDAAGAAGFDVAAGLDAALRTAADTDALVVLAAPVTAFAPLLAAVDRRCPTNRITDVGSVKAPVAGQVEALAPRARYVGSHPMAGTAQSGWDAGSATLFRGAAWVTCIDADTPVENWAPVAALALAVGSRVVPAEAAAHDEAVARISHLPHLLALALARVGVSGGSLALSLAASSFADATRVADTRPELIRAMCEANRGPLTDALDDFLGILGVARGSLASTGTLVGITRDGEQARAAFQRRAAGLTAITLSGDDLPEQLLSVGASGGYITGIEQTGSGIEVQAQCPGFD